LVLRGGRWGNKGLQSLSQGMRKRGREGGGERSEEDFWGANEGQRGGQRKKRTIHHSSSHENKEGTKEKTRGAYGVGGKLENYPRTKPRRNTFKKTGVQINKTKTPGRRPRKKKEGWDELRLLGVGRPYSARLITSKNEKVHKPHKGKVNGETRKKRGRGGRRLLFARS